MKWDQVGHVGHGVSTALFIQYLFKFSRTVFKMPLDSGRFQRKHAKDTVVLEKYSWLSADFLLVTTGCH